MSGTKGEVQYPESQEFEFDEEKADQVNQNGNEPNFYKSKIEPTFRSDLVFGQRKELYYKSILRGMKWFYRKSILNIDLPYQRKKGNKKKIIARKLV